MNRAAGVAVVLVAAAMTGCGGKDRDTTTPNDVASQASFAAKADAICARANKREAAAGAPGPGWIHADEFDDVEFLQRFNGGGREAVRELRRLELPAAQRDHGAAMVDAIAAEVRALDGRIADLETGGGSASRRVNAYIRAYADLTTAAAVLGLTECQGVSL